MSSKPGAWPLAAAWAVWVCTALAQPLPQISANGGQGHVVAPPGMAVDVGVALQAGGTAGIAGDWWLAADAGGSLLVYSFTQGWGGGLAPTLQAPLADVPWLRVLTVPGLPVGRYTLYFAVDTHMNGVLDDDLRYGTVALSVPDWTCAPAGRDSRASLSPVQQRFIAARGSPRLFTLAFLGEDLDAAGRAAAASTPRRVETWLFGRGGLVASHFDNGHFVGETRHGGADPSGPATHLGPGQFSACMTRAQVVSMLGEPSCALRGDFAGRSLEHLRYKPTATRSAATLVLENGVLVGVMAGYSFATAGVDSTELCPKP